MNHYYVFNGDADGLCALHQLRLAEPGNAHLDTGVKRDIKLLDRVEVNTGDRVTVLDISLDSNRTGLMRLLGTGAIVDYFDHHHAGEIPLHDNLTTYIDLSSDICTSLLADQHLKGKFHAWAIVAAFGDNLIQKARQLANSFRLTHLEFADWRPFAHGMAFALVAGAVLVPMLHALDPEKEAHDNPQLSRGG